MNIIGIGIDIVDNSRIEKSIKSKVFLNRIFSKKEILLFKKNKNKKMFFAKRLLSLCTRSTA